MTDVTNGGLRGDAHEISNTTGVGLEFWEEEIRNMVTPNVLNMLETLNIDPLGVSTDSLMLIVPQDISKGRIEIFAVGEDNSHEKLPVAAANSNDINSQSLVEHDEILFWNMRAGTSTKINFELRDEKNYALGVAVYED